VTKQKNKKKIKVSKIFNDIGTSDFDGYIDDIISMLVKTKKMAEQQGFETARINAEPTGDGFYLEIVGEREETDEEYAARLAHEEQVVAWQAAIDKKEYFRLKNKLGL
jgi:hypothetical protein